MSAWIESSGLISADHPPLGLSPSSGTAAMAVILTDDGLSASAEVFARRVGLVVMSTPSLLARGCLIKRILGGVIDIGPGIKHRGAKSVAGLNSPASLVTTDNYRRLPLEPQLPH